ncbi:MAG: hypothetical protein IJ289_03500 [Clostridia bacterium]|nr:hypothetical protein [Clostridia bacterium]
MKRKRNKCPFTPGSAFVFLGVGIVSVCIFPSQWMVVIMAVILVVAGITLMKH